MQPGGPALYAGALGPKATARAAQWATGISGFSLSLDVGEIGRAVEMATTAWRDAGRHESPRYVVACFFALGSNASETLRRFTHEYLAIFGDDFAHAMAASASLSSAGALAAALDTVATHTPTTEVILVPATVDPACAELAAAAVAEWMG